MQFNQLQPGDLVESFNIRLVISSVSHLDTGMHTVIWLYNKTMVTHNDYNYVVVGKIYRNGKLISHVDGLLDVHVKYCEDIKGTKVGPQ
jgi:hypothetical protein